MEENSVHLSGTVEACRIVGEVGHLSVAKLTVVTLHPRESRGEVPSEIYDKFRHVVRLLAGPELSRDLNSLSRELRTEKASLDSGVAVLHPCSLDGVLRTVDGETFVDVDGKDFSFVEKVATVDNNFARLEGRVSSLSYTDGSARLSVRTKAGEVGVFFAKDVNREGWDSVAAGQIRRGDRVALSGPLVDREFTDGMSRSREYYLIPRVLRKLALEKKRKPTGPQL